MAEREIEKDNDEERERVGGRKIEKEREIEREKEIKVVLPTVKHLLQVVP